MVLRDLDLFEGDVNKVDIAIKRLQEFEPPGGYGLGFSGGKDSCVILRLAYMAGVEFTAYYRMTTIDPPEVTGFIKRAYPEVIWQRPDRTFFQELRRRGVPPFPKLRWCCQYFKEARCDEKVMVLGIRWAESPRRKKTRKMFEVNHRFKSRRFLNPIIDWDDYDVWEFIKQEDVPYCPLYDESFRRIGCILCPMAPIPWKKLQIKRWPKFYNAFRHNFHLIYHFRAKKYHPGRWESPDQYFRWWLFGKHEPGNQCGQISLFNRG